MKIVRSDCQLGESPIYDTKNNSIYWLDLNLAFLHKYDLRKKKHSKFKINVNTPLGSIFKTNKGRFILSSDSGIHLLNPSSKKISFLTDLREDKLSLTYNDGIADGRNLYIGLSHRKEKKPIGFFYFFDGKSINISASNFPVANGPSIFKNLIAYSNSALKRIEIYSKKNNQFKKNIKIRIGYPDGTCFDTKGGLWIAHWGGGQISRYSKDFKRDFSIKLPAKNITSLCFAGLKRDYLFITSAKVDTSKKDLLKYPNSGDSFIVKTEFKGISIKDFNEKYIKKLRLLHHQH